MAYKYLLMTNAQYGKNTKHATHPNIQTPARKAENDIGSIGQSSFVETV
jgi:hypothetical protein